MTVAENGQAVISPIASRMESHVVQTCDELPRITSGQLGATGQITVKQTRPFLKQAAIVGKAPSSLGLAPYGDPSWSIWGLSDGWRTMPRPVRETDVWFELHDLDTGRKKRWPPEYFEWMKQNQEKVPLYIGHRLRVNKYSIADMTLEEAQALDAETKPYKELPHAKAYPVYEVLWRFGTYFNNSISFMMALAAMKGVTNIGIYGVDMAQSDPVTGQNGEYEHQRPSCEYMLGVLKGMGIKTFVPGEADLLKCRHLYAFETHGCEDEEERKRKAREKELNDSIAKSNAIIQQHQASMIARQGALDQMRYDFRRSR